MQTLEDPPVTRFLSGGEVVLEVAAEKAQQASQLLQSRPQDPLKVTIRGDTAVLWIGQQTLAEVGPVQAKRWGTTPFSLARTFQGRLEAMRSGRVQRPRLDPARLTVPLGEERAARWIDVAGSPQVQVSDPGVASVALEGSRVKVQGVGEGQAVVTLTWPSRSLELPVVVRPWAARLPDSMDVTVTGERLGAPELEEALRRALLARTSLHTRAGLEVRFARAPAFGTRVPVKVTASGPGLLAVEKSVSVGFARSTPEVGQASALVMSNRPEKVVDLGILLRQPLPPGPSRLLFHHRNMPGHPERYLEVLLANRTSVPAKVLVIAAAVGPSQDEIYAGHLATAGFVKRLLERRGLVLGLKPGETITLERLRMKTGQTVSGMGWLQPLEGGGLELVVRSVGMDGETSDADLAEPGSGPFPTGRGAFPPEIHGTFVHDTGSRYTFVPLGDAPFTADPATGEPNPGNFGVVHRLRLVLRNPTGQTRDAWLQFIPRGGPARGLFFVDGDFIETGLGTHGSPVRLGRWTLAPGETRDVLVETFPQSGSNYPVNLVIESDYAATPAGPRPEEGPPLTPQFLP